MRSATVVGAAIIRDGRLLAARRRLPPHLAGRWELPGGKVEPGESEPAALARELAEELSVQAEIGALVGRAAITPDSELAIYLCPSFTGRPRLGPDHDAITWLTAATIDSVDWLDVDRTFLTVLSTHLR